MTCLHLYVDHGVCGNCGEIMAVVKDWMQEAVEELIDSTSVDDPDKPDIIAWARAIIAKHCPMQDDVAYMPVPRCETCKHWKRDEITMARTAECLRREMGVDVLTSHGSSKKIHVQMQTRHDFGCVQWEAK